MAKNAKTVIQDVNSIYKNQSGMFADHPASTPKYAVNHGIRDAEYRENMARMFLSVADVGDTEKQKFLNTLGTGAVRDIANVLVGSSGSGGYIDFMLSRVDESFQEKVQVNDVQSDNYVAFFFGQAPPIFSFSGFLLNTYQDDHRLGMHLAYQNLLRGVQLARHKALVRIRYDSVIVSGALLNVQQSLLAENEMAIPFNFQLLVKSFFLFEEPTVTQKVTGAFNPAGDAFPDLVAAPSTARVKTLVVTAPQTTGDSASTSPGSLLEKVVTATNEISETTTANFSTLLRETKTK